MEECSWGFSGTCRDLAQTANTLRNKNEDIQNYPINAIGFMSDKKYKKIHKIKEEERRIGKPHEAMLG